MTGGEPAAAMQRMAVAAMRNVVFDFTRFKKLLTPLCPEQHNAACVKSASSDKSPPLTFFPLGETAKGSFAKNHQ